MNIDLEVVREYKSLTSLKHTFLYCHSIGNLTSNSAQKRYDLGVSRGEEQLSINDLVKSQVLKVGDELIWRRKSLNVQHSAKIVAGGKIETADGVSHKTPSGAAKHLNGNKPVDGWLAWKLKSSNKPIATLREKNSK